MHDEASAPVDWPAVVAELMKAGWTQERLAAVCGCEQSTISKIASGRIVDPSSSIGLALLRCAGLKPERDTRLVTSRELTQALCAAMNIPVHGAAVLSVTLECTGPDHIPRLTIVRALNVGEMRAVCHLVQDHAELQWSSANEPVSLRVDRTPADPPAAPGTGRPAAA